MYQPGYSRGEYYGDDRYSRSSSVQKPASYYPSSQYQSERDQYSDYQGRRPTQHTSEAGRYQRNHDYRSAAPINPLYQERQLPTYFPPDRPPSTRLPYEQVSGYHPGEYDRRTSIYAEQKAPYPSRARHPNAQQYPERIETFARRRVPSYESLRAGSNYVPSQAPSQAPSRSEYSEAPRRETYDRPQSQYHQHAAYAVEERLLQENDRKSKASFYGNENDRKLYTSSFKGSGLKYGSSKSLINMKQSQTSPTMPIAPSDKPALPEAIRQHSKKMEALLRTTSKLSTSEQPPSTEMESQSNATQIYVEPKQETAAFKSLASMTRDIVKLVLDRTTAMTEDEWNTLCGKVQSQLKIIETLESQ